MKKVDIIILSGILILSIMLMVFMKYVPNLSSEMTAVINIKEETYRVNFSSTDIFEQTIPFERGTLTVEFNKGKVSVREMDKSICPKGICSKTGWIDKSYQTIVCLPNKISVKIIDGLDTKINSIDSISN
ncbi:MAG: hypothetical protein BGO41_07265 [Clostridiales bacterium 38-18]|nr:MAG: hypothetical protein BGO41_07265 [Clostridiales bacterium 38-18]